MRYLFFLGLSSLLVIAIWIGMFFVQLGAPTQHSKWVHEAYELKERAASAIVRSKVLIVSGSNSLFGFNSRKLEDHWGIPVVNGAVHAGLDLPYILERSKRSLVKGDLVLLPLEYQFYQSDGEFSEIFIDFIVSRDPGYFFELSVADQALVIFKTSLDRMVTGLMYKFFRNTKPTMGVYGVQSINEYGDQINLEPENMTEREYAGLAAAKDIDVGSGTLSVEFVEAFDNYSAWATRNGICLIGMPPNRLRFESAESEMHRKLFDSIRGFFRRRNLAFIGDNYDYMYDKRLYFNTASHLNAVGVEVRTEQVLIDLGRDPYNHCKNIRYGAGID
jgi:hypothetical protein